MDEPTQETLTQLQLDTAVRTGIRAFLSRLEDESLPPVSRCILYGSYARGHFDEDSDVDLAVVFPGEPPPIPGHRFVSDGRFATFKARSYSIHRYSFRNTRFGKIN